MSQVFFERVLDYHDETVEDTILDEKLFENVMDAEETEYLLHEVDHFLIRVHGLLDDNLHHVLEVLFLLDQRLFQTVNRSRVQHQLIKDFQQDFIQHFVIFFEKGRKVFPIPFLLV